LCSRIVVLHHGEMLAEGAPADIVVDQRVISAYFGKRAS
jgi:branched-chain amino acid transport system ATP-binding protein